MRRRNSNSSSRPSLRDRLILLLVVLGVTAGFAYAYSRRNVHHIHLAPGQSVDYRVELPMQKPYHSKEYVNEMGLPVLCTLRGVGARDRVSVSVERTGHGIHRMWADLVVTADRNAKPGTRLRLVDFTIDGRNDWPQASLYIHVD